MFVDLSKKITHKQVLIVIMFSLWKVQYFHLSYSTPSNQASSSYVGYSVMINLHHSPSLIFLATVTISVKRICKGIKNVAIIVEM